jgi:hypothetical protein
MTEEANLQLRDQKSIVEVGKAGRIRDTSRASARGAFSCGFYIPARAFGDP